MVKDTLGNLIDVSKPHLSDWGTTITSTQPILLVIDTFWLTASFNKFGTLNGATFTQTHSGLNEYRVNTSGNYRLRLRGFPSTTFAIQNLDFTASITPPVITDTIYTAVSPPGSGSVNKGTHTKTRGSLDTLQAIANTGRIFINWTRKGTSTVISTANPYIFTVSHNDSLVANFEKQKTVITLNPNGGLPTPPQIDTVWYGDTLINLTPPTYTCKTLNAYYTSTTGGTKIANAEGKLENSIPNYTSSTGSWLSSLPTLTLYARWDNINYIITASAGANGTIIPNGNTNVVCGSTLITTITPATNYQLDSVFKDNALIRIGGALTDTFTNISEDHSIRAIFRPIMDTVTVLAGTNITISPDPANHKVIVQRGTSQNFTFTPAIGYHVDTVRVNGTYVGIGLTNYLVQNLTGNISLSVIAKAKKYSVLLNGGGTGTNITSYTYGIGATLPTDWTKYGQIDSGWYSDPLYTSARQTHISPTDTGDKKFYKRWIQIYDTVFATSGGHGSIIPSGNISVEYGSDTSFSFIPDNGYIIDSLFVDGVFINTGLSSYSLTNITTHKTINILFKPITYTITYNPNNGTTIPDANYTIETPTFALQIPSWLGHNFRGWRNSESLTGDSLYQISQGSTGDKEFWAKWDTIRFSLTSNSGPNGSINPSGEIVVDYASSLSYSFSPAKGYKVKSIKVDGSALSGTALTDAITNGYTFINIIANHTIEVQFEEIPPNQFYITLNANPADLGTVQGSGAYDSASIREIKAIAMDGSHFVKWIDNTSNTISTDETMSIKLTKDTTLTAIFAKTPKPRYNVIVQIIPDITWGTVKNTGQRDSGEVITLIAEPASGKRFVKYTDISNNLISENSSYKLTVTQNIELKAVFDSIITITVISSDGGTATVNNNGLFESDTKATITAKADDDYEFINWTDDTGNIFASQPIYTFTVTKSLVLTANFREKVSEQTKPTIISQSLDQYKNTGETLTIYIEATGNPSPSFQWFKDSVEITDAIYNTYTKTNITIADSGIYICRVYNTEGEVVSDPIKVHVTTGITETKHYIQVVFNGEDQIYLTIPPEITVQNIQLYDILGRIVGTWHATSNTSLFIPNLHNGSYYLLILHNLGMENYRLVRTK